MSKCSYELTEVVRVEVTGKKREFPMVPDDGGLIGELLQWLWDNKIHSAVPGGESGGGRHIAYYTKENAIKIREWLDDRKVKKVKSDV